MYAHLGQGVQDMVTEAGSNGDYKADPKDKINVPVGAGSFNYSTFLAVGAKAGGKAA